LISSSYCFFCQLCPLLSSPLHSFLLMVKVSKSIHFMEIWADDPCEELDIITGHSYSVFSSVLFFWCIDALSSWSNDARHVSEATTTWVFGIYCYAPSSWSNDA
jgi:hypothetical protein